MDVRFYDRDFNLIHIEPFYKSLSMELNFNGMGTFEMCVPSESKLSALALEGEFLAAYHRQHMMIICSRRFEEGKTVLYGRTMNFLMEKRVVLPFEAFEGDALEKVRGLVEGAFPDVVFESEPDSLGTSAYSVQKPQTLLETLCNILEEKGAGHSFNFDPVKRKWVFKVLESKERGLFLSESLLNMYAFEKTDSILDSANCGYYLQKARFQGNWEPLGNVPYLTESAERIGEVYCVSVAGVRFGIEWEWGDYAVFDKADGKCSKYSYNPEEVYVLVGEEKSAAERMECFLDGENIEDALKSLAKMKAESDVVAKVKNVTFGKDYFLGDKVVLCKKTGEKIIKKKVKITGVSLWQQNADEGEMPRFTGEEE